MNMGPLTFNTLGDQQHPYVQCTYGSSYQNPTNPGILGSGNVSSHAIITTDGPDPCRCYSINGQAYVHENYLPPFWNMDYTDHLDTAIRVGCGTGNSICYKASQIEYWFYPEKENSTLMVLSSFAMQNAYNMGSTYGHGSILSSQGGCANIINPQFYIEVFDGETDQLLDLGYYPTKESQQTANPVANTHWPYSRFLAWPSGCSWPDDSHNAPDDYGITTYYWAGQNSNGYATPTTFLYRECPSNQTEGNSSSYPVQWLEYKPLAFSLKNIADQNVDSLGNFAPVKSVKLRIHTQGCEATAHWAYGLFAAKMIPGSIQVEACGDENLHLSVPTGFLPQTYEWHYGYDALDACNHFWDFTSDPVPGITPDGMYGVFLDRDLIQIYPYYRCEMKSYTGVPFVYEAYVKFYDIVSDFTYEQDFSAEEIEVQFHDGSTVYAITPPTTPPSQGGTYDTLVQSAQHTEWYVKHDGSFQLFAENVAGPTHTFTNEEIDENGMATVMLKTYAGGCVDSVEKTFPLSLVAVPERPSNYLTLYPNPTTGLMSISAEKEILRIEVFTLDGKILISKAFQKNSGHIDLSSYATGCYTATIHFADGTSEQVKIIKQ